MNEDECRTIRVQYEHGASVADLADDYQVSQGVIRRALLRAVAPTLGHVLPSCLHRSEWVQLHVGAP